jgi:hypothetical protein
MLDLLFQVAYDDTPQAFHQLACENLVRIVNAARAGNMPSRIFLMSDDGQDWLESVGIDVEAAREQLVRQWCEKATGLK